MRAVLVILGTVALAALARAQEGGGGAPVDELPVPRRLESPSCSVPPAPHRLNDLLQEFRAEREALQSTCGSLARELEEGLGPVEGDTAVLRARVGELLARIEKAKAAAPRALPPDVTGPTKRPVPSVRSAPEPPALLAMPHGAPPEPGPAIPASQPVDAVVLGQALFRAGNYEAALKTLQSADVKNMAPETRLAVQYLSAICLRQLGKASEAMSLFREAANSRLDEYLALCAQWELAQLRWKQGTLERLSDLRKRRTALDGGAP